MSHKNGALLKTSVKETRFIPRSLENLYKVKESTNIVHDNADRTIKLEQATDIEHSEELKVLVKKNSICFDPGCNIKSEEIEIKTECFHDLVDGSDDFCNLTDSTRDQNESTESCSSRQIEFVNVTVKTEQPCFEMIKNETDTINHIEDNENQFNIDDKIKIEDSLTIDGCISNNTHTKRKPYVCDVCNKAFTYSSHFKRHKRIHTGEKPYFCDVCNKCFTQSGDLRVHKRIHTGEKPFVCDVCNKCFTQSSDLKVHKRSHIGEKPYVCDICNWRFVHISNLVRHKRIHTDGKNFFCDVCNKGFSNTKALTIHRRIHTGIRPYVCDICDKSFLHTSSLAKHKRIHSEHK